MKICHIVASLAERHGGPSKSVRAVCAALARAEHEVELLTTTPRAPAAGDSQQDGRLHVRTFAQNWPLRICRSTGIKRALRTSRVDVVHHHGMWQRTLHYAHQEARRQRAAFVVSPRGMMSRWAWNHHRWRKAVSRHLIHPGALDAVTGWHATSDEEAREIRALGFSQPICVAANGVEAPDPAAVSAAVDHWHEACPATLQRPVAVFYSRFHQKKRVVELIDVWLERAPRDWLLLLVGIPEAYTPEVLERYVQRMSGGGRVAAFSGAGRPPPYAVGSIFLLPSHNENFGLAIAEAMAHGLPVVVTDTTPWSTIQRDGLGWCVPWERFGPTLASAVTESQQSLKQRGARAREWVLREYSWDRSASLLGDFYQQLTQASR